MPYYVGSIEPKLMAKIIVEAKTKRVVQMQHPFVLASVFSYRSSILVNYIMNTEKSK